jgi:MoaA/NifB/PqqE/SkfB family radical SAM enzyme
MRDADYFRIVDECAGFPVRSFKPFLMNEPLLDNRLPRFIAYARRRLRSCVIGFGTNGSHLCGRMAAELLDSGVSEICVNFPGHQRATYEHHMLGLAFTVVRDNLIQFAAEVHRRGLPIRLLTCLVETARALPEAEASRAFWKEHGVEVTTIPLNNRGGHVNDGGLRVLPPATLRRVCDRPFHHIYIRYSGHVILCSSDWSASTILGNVVRTGIQPVWQGQRQREVRKRLLAGDLESLTLRRDCDYPSLFSA